MSNKTPCTVARDFFCETIMDLNRDGRYTSDRCFYRLGFSHTAFTQRTLSGRIQWGMLSRRIRRLRDEAYRDVDDAVDGGVIDVSECAKVNSYVNIDSESVIAREKRNKKTPRHSTQGKVSTVQIQKSIGPPPVSTVVDGEVVFPNQSSQRRYGLRSKVNTLLGVAYRDHGKQS